MPKVHSIGSALPLNWSIMDREGHSVSLAKGHDFGPGPRRGPLLSEHELASGEISLRLGEQEGDLYGEDMLSVNVRVKTIVIARIVLEKWWSRPLLTRIVA